MSQSPRAFPTSAAESDARWVTADVRRILLAQLLFGFGWSLYLLLPKYYSNVLHVGPELLGRISATGGIAGLLCAPVAGYALDRLGRVTFFRLGSAVLLALSLGFFEVQEVGPLVFVLHGAVAAAFVLSFNSTAALITDHAPASQMGLAIGWLGGVNVAMNAVATVIAEPLATHYGWHLVFMLGAGTAALALLFSLTLREGPGRVVAGSGRAEKSQVQTAAVVVVLLVTTLKGACFVGIFSFVQPYVLASGGAEIRNFLVGFSAAAVLCRVLMGGLGDRFGRVAVSGWALCGYAACAYLMVSLDVSDLLYYGLAFGAAHGVLYPTLNALFSSIMPPARRGLSMVLYNGAFNLGMIIGSWRWGRLAERQGYPVMYQYVAAVALVGALLLWWRRPGRPLAV